MQKLVGCLVALLVCGCAGHDANKQDVVRVRFDPDSSVSSASWTCLEPIDDDTEVLMATADVGIGGSFPVQDKQGQTFFEVSVAEGNDDFLVVHIDTTEWAKRTKLRRDKPESMEIAGHRYELLYPSVDTLATSKTTTNKARLIVLRYP